MTFQNILPYIFVLIAGMIVPPAVALNTILARSLKSPLLSAVTVMFVGGVFVTLLTLLMRQTPPPTSELSKIPWFIWLGGILISLYMVLMNYNVSKVGVGLATALVVAGQILTGLAIDHYGLFGLPQASMSFGRLFGVIAIVGGVLLVKYF